MASFIASNRTVPDGSYVVGSPLRTDAIGDILRASFSTRDDAGEEMKRLLSQIDRPARLS